MATTSDPLNGLLAIRDGSTTARWNFDDAVGSLVTSPAGIGHSASLKYSFLTAVPSYYNGVPAGQQVTGFAAFSSFQKTATRQVIASFAHVMNLHFTEVAQGGQISFAMESQGSESGYAYYPSYQYYYSNLTNKITSVSELPMAGDVWLNANEAWTAADFALGNHGYGTLVHELGHALGLKHSFSSNLGASGYVITPALDNNKYTVMSYTPHPYGFYREVTAIPGGGYNVQWHYIEPETLMPFDIAALQYLYGANASYNSGNTTYTFEIDRPFIKTIWDGGGIDTISVSNFTLGCVIDLRAGYYSSIRIPSDPMPAGHTDSNTGIYDGTDNLAIAYKVVIENAIGGSGNDKLVGNNVANGLNGRAGADAMFGGDGSDVYYVDDAGDVVTESNVVASSGGIDHVHSYLSAYTLPTNVENGRILTAGDANLSGNSLTNLLYAGLGSNIINGGNGIDTVSYLYGVTGSNGVNVNLSLTVAQTTGGSGSDTLLSIERLNGSNNNDRLTGNAGANLLSGLTGNDVLKGEAGNDLLIGGLGKDSLAGGAGADVFDFNSLSELGLGTLKRDVITDFARGQDKMDLSTIDAVASVAGNQAFAFKGSAAFTAAGQVRYAGGIVYINSDADTAAEYEIQLTGVVPAALAATDFVL